MKSSAPGAGAGAAKRVLVRLLPSFRYIPVNCYPEDTVGDICKRVARHGYSAGAMSIWFVAEPGRSAPDKAAEAAAWRRGPLDHRLKLVSARIDPGAWLLAEEDAGDAAKAAAPSALALGCSRLAGRLSHLCACGSGSGGSGGSSSGSGSAAGGARRAGGAGGGGADDGSSSSGGSSGGSGAAGGAGAAPSRAPAGLALSARNLSAGLVFVCLMALQLYSGGGGGGSSGGGSGSSSGASIFSIPGLSLSSSSGTGGGGGGGGGASGLHGRYLGGVLWEDSFSEPTAAASLDFSTYGSLEGGSAAIIAAVDRAGGGSQPPCYDMATVKRAVQRLLGLPACLEVGGLYSATVVAEDQDGRPRACGGDYFEALLYGGGDTGSAGPILLKRPWLTDGGSGNYSMQLHVPALPFLVGDYVLNVHPLFLQGSGFGRHGPLTLKQSVARMNAAEDLTVRLYFGAEGSCSSGGKGGGGGGGGVAHAAATPALVKAAQLAKAPPVCKFSSMKDPAWRGYWLKAPSAYGAGGCEPPYCAPGSAPILSVMDDNKDLWVYRREQCVFRLWHPRQARQCLAGRSLLGMGDSNLQDSLRNLMMHALQVDPAFFIPNGDLYLDRTFNFSGVFPSTVSPGYGELPEFALQMGMIFSGHWNIRVKGGLGVKTYANATWLADIAGWWARLPRPPDFLVVNDAGLHTCQWTAGDPHGVADSAALLEGVVVPWWLKNHHPSARRGAGGEGAGGGSSSSSSSGAGGGTGAGLSEGGGGGGGALQLAPPAPPPRLIFRSNVVPGHDFRVLKANPQSLEAQNALAASALVKALRSGAHDIKTAAIVDFYDMTFPFHYYDFYGDGGHYGRPIYYIPPGRTSPYTHFVDDQCVQVLLSALCA